MTTLRELAQAAMAIDKDSDEFEFALWDILQEHGIDFNGVEALETFLAALDAEREAGRALAERRGRAEIFGLLLAEFKRESQSATDRARYSTKPHHEGYAMAMQDVVRTVRSRAGMMGADSDDRSAWEALVAYFMGLNGRAGSGTEAARDAATDNAPETEAP